MKVYKSVIVRTLRFRLFPALYTDAFPFPSTKMIAARETPVAFISGPVAPPEEYFTKYYPPQLDKAILEGHSFVMGPAPGIDSLSLRYLVDRGVEIAKITVYLAEFEEKTLAERVKWFVDLGGKIKVEGVTTGDRDAAMTRDSDYDILRYMSIEEQKEFYGEKYYPRVSATEKNERRRKGLPLHANYGLVGYGVSHKVVEEGASSSWRTRMKNAFQKYLRK
jgi:hypothetical protein